jgi:hypothetical protein
MAGEPSYRGFCECPSSDLLRGVPIGSSGPGIRMSPLIIAGRLSKMYIFRLMHSSASPGGTNINLTTRKYPEAHMNELRPVLLEASTALMKASRHRFEVVTSQAVEAFGSNFTEVSICNR